MSYAPPRPNGRTRAQAEVTDNLSPAERHIMEMAKREHRDTTAAAKRAAQIADETVDAGRNTLVEIHRQGEQLDHIERGLDHMEEDVKEASSLVKFMRRWCCWQLCCCCLDPEHKKGRPSRQQRLKMRGVTSLDHREEVANKHMSAAAAVDRLIKRDDVAYNGDETGQRSELFQTAEAIRSERKTTSIGFGKFPGMAESDRSELDSETLKQEGYLDSIGKAVESMKALGQEMSNELQVQDTQIERLPTRAVKVNDDLNRLNKTIAKI
ncbi:hypothetical protein ACKKBG_A00455 [Auxenochlorella protothecoides x Auxenochlorella symbiontica]